jgi:hypothetical protein
MKLTSWLVLASLCFGSVGACGKAGSGDQLGGETHWLRPCASDDECGPTLECRCGVCTRVCDAASSCAGLGSEAQCAASGDTEFASACEGGSPTRLCVQSQNIQPVEMNGTPIWGMPYEADAVCFGAMEVAGTAANRDDSTCLPIQTLANDPEGNCWRFTSTCLPDGFAPLNPLSDYACREANDTCSDALSCRTGEVPTPDGCLECDAAYAQLYGEVNALLRASGWDACNSDLDCIGLSWQFSCANDLCGTPIVARFSQSFLDGARAIVAQHCSDPADWAECPQLVPDCEGGAICRQGRCVGGGVPCAERSLETCDDDGDCVLAAAFPFNTEQQCFAGTSSAVGCVDPDLSCPPVTTPALDGDGDCFLFGNCLPAGFQRAPEGHPCAAALGSTCSN